MISADIAFKTVTFALKTAALTNRIFLGARNGGESVLLHKCPMDKLLHKNLSVPTFAHYRVGHLFPPDRNYQIPETVPLWAHWHKNFLGEIFI